MIFLIKLVEYPFCSTSISLNTTQTEKSLGNTNAGNLPGDTNTSLNSQKNTISVETRRKIPTSVESGWKMPILIEICQKAFTSAETSPVKINAST
jgi:hypothetical protein